MKVPGNIANLFFEQANKQPEKLAIISAKRSVSYGGLRDEVAEYTGYLMQKGVQKGDRVLVFVPVSIDLYKVVMAIISLGAVAVFLDQWSDLKRLRKSAHLAQCKVLIAGTRLRCLAWLFKEFREIPLKLPVNSRGDGHYTACIMQSDDAALITFTTGSSGTPKAAWRTHGFLYHQHRALIKETRPTEGEVNMTTLPIFVFSNLASGLTTLLPNYNPKKPGEMKPDVIWSQLKKHTAASLICSPDFLLGLLPLAEKYATRHLQKVFTGGAMVSPEDARLIKEVFPGAIVAYGSTEAEPISSIPVSELAASSSHDLKGIPAGNIHPDISLKIIPIQDEINKPDVEKWKKMTLAKNQIGEIVVSGDHVLKRYFNNVDAQAYYKIEIENAIWHRTGDSGFIDENRKLLLTGPCKRMIKLESGEWLSPFLVERKLKKLASVKEGTVIMLTGKLILFAVKRPGFTRRAARAEIEKAGLIQEEIKFIEALPKDPRHNSKIDYERLVLLFPEQKTK